MASKLQLFTMALAERSSRIWSRHLEWPLSLEPCKPYERYGVEVMVGLPPFSCHQALNVAGCRALVTLDSTLLLGAIDRLLGGQGVPPDDDSPSATLVEEAIGRKLISKLLPGINEIWAGFCQNLEEISFTDEEANLRSPWEPTEQVIETTLKGGWDGCVGYLRFFWPKSLMTNAFGDIDVERIEVDKWTAEPWMPTFQRPVPPPPQTVYVERVPEAPEATEKPPATKPRKRISFDDLDSVIDAINKI